MRVINQPLYISEDGEKFRFKCECVKHDNSLKDITVYEVNVRLSDVASITGKVLVKAPRDSAVYALDHALNSIFGARCSFNNNIYSPITLQENWDYREIGVSEDDKCDDVLFSIDMMCLTGEKSTIREHWYPLITKIEDIDEIAKKFNNISKL